MIQRMLSLLLFMVWVFQRVGFLPCSWGWLSLETVLDSSCTLRVHACCRSPGLAFPSAWHERKGRPWLSTATRRSLDAGRLAAADSNRADRDRWSSPRLGKMQAFRGVGFCPRAREIRTNMQRSVSSSGTEFLVSQACTDLNMQVILPS